MPGPFDRLGFEDHLPAALRAPAAARTVCRHTPTQTQTTQQQMTQQGQGSEYTINHRYLAA